MDFEVHLVADQAVGVFYQQGLLTVNSKCIINTADWGLKQTRFYYLGWFYQGFIYLSNTKSYFFITL